MSDVTELRCWPCCVSALDWSHDGIIALASDERVELLFPNTESFDTEQQVASWRHFPLQVPWFTTDELPVKEPAPISTFSIGEEISSSLPTHISWSPPGLAKHRRCALGALTANLVLSIWAADGKPQDESSWDRRLIVNHALEGYFLKSSLEKESHVVPDVEEKIRLRMRVRAFAWAPGFPNAHSSGIVGTQLTWAQHILAASNDDNQIALVLIESPTSTLGIIENWNAEVLNHFAVTPDPESIFSEPSFFDDIMNQQRHISHLAWSPWTMRGDRYHSVLVYATNRDIRARVVTYAQGTIGFDDEVIYPDIELRHAGPMKWSQTMEDDERLTLALFTNSSLICLSISPTKASILNQTIYELDGHWDQISGVAWDHVPKGSPQLHFCSLTSTMNSPTAVVRISSDNLTPQKSPNWCDHIRNIQVLYSAQNELKGNVKSKVWGLSTSPLGDFIASCHSVHPSDMIEYGQPNDRRSTIAISNLRNYSKISDFPSGNVTAEGILFTVRKCMENTVEDADHVPGFTEEVLKKLTEAYEPIVDSSASSSTSITAYNTGDINDLIIKFKQTAFLDQHILNDRYTILISQACRPLPSNDLQKILIAYRLAAAIQQLPASLSQTTPFSLEILSQHQQLIYLVRELTDEDSMNAQGGFEDDSSQLQPQSNSQLQSATESPGTETCDFCNAAIPFTDLTSAICINNHQFPRCGLSFLAIQAPGITKYCGICSTPFLSDEFISLQEGGSRATSVEGDRQVEAAPDGAGAEREDINLDDNQMQGTTTGGIYRSTSKELQITLARVLFLACDACIYCGGKFVG